MLRVCEMWAADIGLTFNVPKCKTMVLAGPPISGSDLSRQKLSLSNESLEWVDKFKYLEHLPWQCSGYATHPLGLWSRVRFRPV